LVLSQGSAVRVRTGISMYSTAEAVARLLAGITKLVVK
jgi:O-methyltransferase involved in polyketide biosynthesis